MCGHDMVYHTAAQLVQVDSLAALVPSCTRLQPCQLPWFCSASKLRPPPEPEQLRGPGAEAEGKGRGETHLWSGMGPDMIGVRQDARQQVQRQQLPLVHVLLHSAQPGVPGCHLRSKRMSARHI